MKAVCQPVWLSVIPDFHWPGDRARDAHQIRRDFKARVMYWRSTCGRRLGLLVLLMGMIVLYSAAVPWYTQAG